MLTLDKVNRVKLKWPISQVSFSLICENREKTGQVKIAFIKKVANMAILCVFCHGSQQVLKYKGKNREIVFILSLFHLGCSLWTIKILKRRLKESISQVIFLVSLVKIGIKQVTSFIL